MLNNIFDFDSAFTKTLEKYIKEKMEEISGEWVVVKLKPKSIKTNIYYPFYSSYDGYRILDGTLYKLEQIIYNEIGIRNEFKNKLNSFNHLSDDKYEKVTTSLTLDGDVTHNNEETNKDTTYDFIEDFFFTTVQNDVHSGGYYYAEDIGVIISYQDFMTISEDKKFLTVNFEDFVLEGVTNSLTYTINTLGMLVNYSMHSYDESQTLDGTITIKYNNEANDFDLDNMEDI